MKYFLEAFENGKRVPVGPDLGYGYLVDARDAAMSKVDEALPNNIVRVYRLEGHAFLAHDGSCTYHCDSYANPYNEGE